MLIVWIQNDLGEIMLTFKMRLFCRQDEMQQYIFTIVIPFTQLLHDVLMA